MTAAHLPTDSFVEQLKRRHEEDIERTRKMYATPWRIYTSADHFETVKAARDRFLPWIVCGVVVWLIVCLSIGGIIRLFEGSLAPLPRPAAPDATRSDYGVLR